MRTGRPYRTIGGVIFVAGIIIIMAFYWHKPVHTPVPIVQKHSNESTYLVFSVMRTGGLCQYGGCRSEARVMSDGSMERIEGTQKTTLPAGKVSLVMLDRITNEIRQLNINEIKSRPFTGVCPTAYDGSEYTFVFSNLGTQYSLASCSYEIDLNSKPFADMIAMMNNQK